MANHQAPTKTMSKAMIPLLLMFACVAGIALWLISYVVGRSPFHFFNMFG